MSHEADGVQIQKALEDLKHNRTGGKKLRLNPRTKKLEVVNPGEHDPDSLLEITPEDARVFVR